MGNKNKKKLKSRKRKFEGADDAKIIEISNQKRRLPENSDVVLIEEINQAEICKDSKSFVLSEGSNILPTRESLVRQLTIAMHSKNLALIEGPIGCGKTFLSTYSSSQLKLPMKTMQMGDQIDSKTLFGSYYCTEVAGQFIWKPSSFSQWLLEPCVILLEDLDLATSDVISTIIQIAASRSVSHLSGNTLKFHEDVCMVATSSGKGKKNCVLDGIPFRIILEPLTDDELRRLAAKAFPRVAHLAKTLTYIFRSLECIPLTSNSRQLASTDLLRGCARINRLPDISCNMMILTELIDVWCLSDPPERAYQLCHMVATSLSITTDQLKFHLTVRQPVFSHDSYSCSIGRSQFSRTPSLSNVQPHRLGHTRDVLQLMERIGVCVQNREPILLVGETGVGKTSIVQTLASSLNITLKVVNLSPTSDSDELITGYKPTTISHILEPFTKFYYEVFTNNFNAEKNKTFLTHLETCLSSGRFHDYLSVVETTAKKALANTGTKLDYRWASVLVRARRIRDGIDKGAAPFALTRGAVLEAAQEGYWLLIDEINLAPPECLDAIVHAISTETHPDFRLLACMNPATDAGKRRLPTGVRTRFTEFYVAELNDPHQLALVVSAYLPSLKSTAVENIVKFYLESRQQFPGSYSLRTLCRALLFAADNIFGSEERSLFEAMCMAFLTNLDMENKNKMRMKIHIAFRVATNITIPPPHGDGQNNYVQVEGYWIERGAELPQEDNKYVITKTVKENMAEIARIVCSGRFPVLLEGETSAGKTSIVCHLARLTGNSVVRINNHEHTDVQEYMGSYVADDGGRLIFREGALVSAVRNGNWIILDELNLAPTDVIEALNRLLDDNRELFVPELNQTIPANPRFRLFATQNPAGTYSGRKRLSRALLSRFIVLKFHHLPLDELSAMVCTRCCVHMSAASKMISVLSELRLMRSLSGLFSARDGLMTLRDVFRWAKRLATDSTCDDWLQVLANHGYFLLAGRCRNKKDEQTVIDTLEKILKRKIDASLLFSVNSPYMPKDINTSGIVLTSGMRRMLVLTEQAWLRNEAVLLVGETGGGKTSLAQVIGRGQLMTINCHERTETADLIGRLRPMENGGFTWSDGIVIAAMRTGSPLLIDEISLAEDSVLERLNPLFEEDRTLLLSDSGAEVQSVCASSNFQIIATMNPGGDYGKKELSKALRNRFTEIWSSCDYEREELFAIFDWRLAKYEFARDLPNPTDASRGVVTWITEFFEKYSHVFRHAPSVRDVVSCADFYGAAMYHGIKHAVAIRESITAVFLDSLPSLQTRVAIDIEDVLKDANHMLLGIFEDLALHQTMSCDVVPLSDCLKIGILSIPYGVLRPIRPKAFSFNAPTCLSNFYRIARGLLVNKPILLEGAPGCGKSSTVMALAQITGHPITRLNLSDQTDLSDLFGSDVPIMTDEGAISFQWEDGPLLKAIKRGEWVLLDEMNLASQSVLEGLNACFDHRRLIYVAELNKSFEIPDDGNCRFFACQNPHVQGGNRRALPKSFINRFTNIYVDDLTEDDVFSILRDVDGGLLGEICLRSMVTLNSHLATIDRLEGGPFSFNLRDLLRWIQLFATNRDMATSYELLYVSRMRNEENKKLLRSLYEEIFGEPCVLPPVLLTADKDKVQIGKVSLHRESDSCDDNLVNSYYILSSQAILLHQLAICVDMQWLSLLIAPRNSGKRAAVEILAKACGIRLESIALNSETDAQELIGSYEQIIDKSAISDSKKLLKERLHGFVDEEVLRDISIAQDLLQLEIATELALSQVTDKNVIMECHEAIQQATQSAIHFAWVDSPFVKAYLEGHWLLIEDVNLCSAAVLDRLNSCLESGGRLVISERQSSFEPLEPHPNFRVFLSMDARNGEISRAMRNRSVELYLGTDQRWYTSIQDVTTLASAFGTEKISKNVAMDLTALPVENLLHFCVLLNEMSVEDACRSLSIGFVETSEKEVCEVLPEVKDLVTESYQSWLVSVWKNTSVEDSLSKIFLCLLSSSTYSIRSRHIEKQFGHIATPFTSRAIEITQDLPLSTHAVDARFNNGCWNREDIYSIDKFVLNLLCEWSLNMIQILIVEQGSTEYLSRTLTKCEVATCDIGFKNLHLISRVVDGILMALKEVSFERKPKKLFCCCLSLYLFVRAARQIFMPRTGCAPLYIAWNDMQITSIFNSSEFSNLNTMMNSEWSVESHERFVRDYLVLYEDHKIVYPFSNEDDCQRLISFVDYRMECDSEEIELDRDFDEYVENRSILKSPIAITLQLVNRMLNLLLFQVTGTVDKSDPLFISQEMLRMFNWMDESTAKFVKMLTVLNSNYNGEDKVSSIPSLGAFSIIYVSFWSSLSFDPSMSLLSISDLRHFELTEFAKQLWQLAPNSPRISQNIKNGLGIITCGLSGWSNQEKEKQNSWEERLETGINIMNNSLPPPKTLDPVIFEEEKAKYIGLKLEIVNRQLQILSEFRYSTSRQFPTCDSRSQHPQIASLWEIREQLNNELNEKKSVKETVYRQRASQYNTLCSELRSFRDVSLSIVSVLHKLNDSIRKVHELSSDEHQIILAQLKSYVMSAVNFKQSTIRKYSSFVDVSLTFLVGVDIMVCATHEACSLVEAIEKRRGLYLTSAFPFSFELMATSRGIESPQLLAWCCRDASTMPLRLKAAIVRRRITERIDPRCDLEWTRRHWQKWYERNVAKAAEKDFIYRNKTEEERDELNVKEFFSVDDQEEGILSTEDLSLLLDALEPQFSKKMNDSNKQTKEAHYSLALVWIRYLLMGIGQFEEKLHSATVEPDLSLLHWIISREDVDHLSIVDVYRSSSLKEFRRAADLLDALITRIKEVQERWPEIVALKLIVDAINNFLSAPLSTTQIKMASRIESVIEQAEEWEKIADRNNSLRDQLEPIRKLLVDWKKMEVRSWGQLLTRTEYDSVLRAQLVAFPLFDALFKAKSLETLLSIIPMATEWIYNSTLIDFSTRIKNIQSLAEWADQLGYKELKFKLRSVSAHFQQYVGLVMQKLKEARDPAEYSLKDYLKIVKYNDLNLWNIRVSSQKAHAHLFKIIRKFKDAINVEVAPIFDNLLGIDEWLDIKEVEHHVQTVTGDRRTKRAQELVEQILINGQSICDITELRVLADQTRACDSHIRTQINYEGTDNEKEKQQGYARNCRQREVAIVIKEAQIVGVNARKAVALVQEVISEQSITEIPEGYSKEKLVRVCASGRNICIRKANHPNDQLGVATRKHLSGIVEYGMAWILKVQKRIAVWETSAEQIAQKTNALNNMKANVEVSWYINHDELVNKCSLLSGNASELIRLVGGMQYILQNVPDKDDYSKELDKSSHLHKLSVLHKGDADFEHLQLAVADAYQLVEEIVQIINKMENFGEIYSKSFVEISMNDLRRGCCKLDILLIKLEHWFERDTAEARNILQMISDQLQVNQIKTTENPMSTDKVLLLIQNLYKVIVEDNKWKEGRLMDRLDFIIDSMDKNESKGVLSLYCSLVSDVRIGVLPTFLDQFCCLGNLVSALLFELNAYVSTALQAFGILYHSILSMALQLFEKGYVNTIPKIEKQESGEGATDETEGGGGIGEGEIKGDAKDVTDEMEESGQIEGLQDDIQEPPSGEAGQNEKPIEMDEDFAEDLQDIDQNEKNNSDDESDGEDEEPETEDQMGDVDNADDQKLDPKLWDKDQDCEMKDIDEDNKAADNKTNNMAAKEDNPIVPEEQSEINDDGVGDENEEDVENIDDRDREDDGKDNTDGDEIDTHDIEDHKDDEINMDETDDDNDTHKGIDDGVKEENREIEDIEDEETFDNKPAENPSDNERPDQDDVAESMEQGTGGQAQEEMDGSGENEDQVDQDEQERPDEQSGKSNDDRGDSGKGIEAKKKDKDNEMENTNIEDQDETVENKRELAREEDITEDAEEGNGEENEAGKKMENTPTAVKQMIDAGTIEEAKESRKEELGSRQNQKKKQRVNGMEEMDVPEEDDGADESTLKQAFIHLAPDDMYNLAEDITKELILGDKVSDNTEEKVDQNVSCWGDAERMWSEISRSVNILSAELAENLRLILEPQRATRMKGDYRTGKRLNMRKLIPYIASDYRKDRIWMRRTKRAQREYQVLVAVDDSGSMNENGIHQVTCEAVCVIDDALRRCEAGAVSVCSFGKNVDTICAFGNLMIPGPELLNKLTFSQSSTDLLQLLNRSRTVLEEARTQTSEQLLIIISDGRGALAQGADKIRTALSALQRVTVLFVILDTGPKSLSELSVASFQGGNVVLTPYMKLFPFPFYAIIKGISQLPSVLAESIRQWFELTLQSAAL